MPTRPGVPFVHPQETMRPFAQVRIMFFFSWVFKCFASR
jgi:hypothetical protein